LSDNYNRWCRDELAAVSINWRIHVCDNIVFGDQNSHLVSGSSFNLALFDIERLNWRLQLAVSAVPAIPLLFLIYTCPGTRSHLTKPYTTNTFPPYLPPHTESPRFLIKKRKWRRAYESLRSLNETDVQAARELFLIHVQNELTKIKWYGKEKSEELMNNLFPLITSDEASFRRKESDDETLKRKSVLNEQVSTYVKRLVNLFSVPRIRRATTAAAVVMISQQLCGVNVMALYSGTILPQPDPNNPDSVRTANKHGLWLGWGWWTIGTLYLSPSDFMTQLTSYSAWPSPPSSQSIATVAEPSVSSRLQSSVCASSQADSASGLRLELQRTTAAYSLLSSCSSQLIPWVRLAPTLPLRETNPTPGLGVVPFTYSAEVFPTVNRGTLLHPTRPFRPHKLTLVHRGRHVPRSLHQPLRRRHSQPLRPLSTSQTRPPRTLRIIRVTSASLPLSIYTLTHPSGLNVLAYILMFIYVYETKQERLEKLDLICKHHSTPCYKRVANLQ
jgi:hypothetical protein